MGKIPEGQIPRDGLYLMGVQRRGGFREQGRRGSEVGGGGAGGDVGEKQSCFPFLAQNQFPAWRL